MSQTTITVGKSRIASFIPMDQNGNPNPMGPDGLPLWPKNPTWSLGEVVTRRDVPPSGGGVSTTGVTLTPAEDGNTCNVKADVKGITLVLYCHADRGDGVIVHGGSIFETIGEGEGPVTTIGSLGIQWGSEQ